ncbi:MAG: hypothetical protein ABIY40_01175 [Rhodanobacteraceae bacterium]|nr:hypothetical protein [Pseudomonadota bacterium]
MADQHTYRYVTDWQRLEPKDGEAIRAFWTREQANVEGDEATRRLPQVVAHVLDEHGEIAAVATAVPKIIPRLGQPMYYYRCFVGQAWRSGKLVRPLLRYTQGVLETYAGERDFPCIGVLLELENTGFAGSMQWAHWKTTGFSYIGKSVRGIDLRVWYFPGARLKSPEELARLAQGAH